MRAFLTGPVPDKAKDENQKTAGQAEQVKHAFVGGQRNLGNPTTVQGAHKYRQTSADESLAPK